MSWTIFHFSDCLAYTLRASFEGMSSKLVLKSIHLRYSFMNFNFLRQAYKVVVYILLFCNYFSSKTLSNSKE